MSQLLALDESDVISFEDAQTDPSLLDPVFDQLSNKMASQATMQGNETSIDSVESRYSRLLSQHKDVEVIDGQLQEEIAEREKEVDFTVPDLEEYRRKEDLKEQAEREKDELKRQKRIETEEIERQNIIELAMKRRGTISAQQQRLDKERKLCTSWTAGRTGTEALGRQIVGHWQGSRPTEKDLAWRNALIVDAERALEKRWPGCCLRLVPFGSTKTGLVEPVSDVDLTLFDPMRPLGVGTPKDQVQSPPEGANFRELHDSIATYGIEKLPDYYSVTKVGNTLRDFGSRKFVKILRISNAKVPIVKFTHAPSGLSSDININDGFGIANSEMLEAYCDFDKDVVRPLIFAVKKWASRRGLNDPAGRSGLCSLNSYTICMIAIQFLQIKGVVPNLQSTQLLSELQQQRTYVWHKPDTMTWGRGVKKPYKTIIGAETDSDSGAIRYDTTFVRVPGKEVSLRKVTGKKTTLEKLSLLEIHCKIGTLYKEFFAWLSEFSFDECGISIRLGTPFRKNLHSKSQSILDMPYLEPPSSQWKGQEPIVCQDPFILDRNTSMAIKKDMRRIIIDESWRARTLLEEEREDESRLLSDLLVNQEHEELVREQEAVLQSLDDEAREIINNSRKKKTSRPYR